MKFCSDLVIHTWNSLATVMCLSHWNTFCEKKLSPLPLPDSGAAVLLLFHLFTRLPSIMEPSDEDNDLANAYRRSMEIVEETLSKLKGTVCSWPKPANFDLGPHKNMTIGHLEDMLSYLKTYSEDGDQQSNEGTEGENQDDSAEHPEVHNLNEIICLQR